MLELLGWGSHKASRWAQGGAARPRAPSYTELEAQRRAVCAHARAAAGAAPGVGPGPGAALAPARPASERARWRPVPLPLTSAVAVRELLARLAPAPGAAAAVQAGGSSPDRADAPRQRRPTAHVPVDEQARPVGLAF
jgi:hypothetical protein